MLYREQAGNQQYFVFANGQQVGTTGMGIDTQAAPGSNGAPAFGEIDDFNIGYRAISARYPSASVGSYRVAAGDSLQSIAQAAYGDSSLWYTLAEANGLSGNADLKVGQTVVIPNKVAGIHNNGSTFTPYDPSRAVGSTTPNLPQPQAEGGGCGGLGTILTLAVVIAVAALTEQYYLLNYGTEVTAATTATDIAATTAATYTTGSVVAASVVGGAAGAIAGQLVGNALGVQHGFSWEQVGLSAISAGMSAGVAAGAASLVGAEAASSTAGMVARAVTANALTQGVGVVTGLQHSFNWMSVAASAVGTGVGSAVGRGLGVGASDPLATRVAAGTLSGLAAGTATAALRGGRVSVQQIATDAFGNALGDSIVHTDWNGSQQESELTSFRQSEIAAMNADAQTVQPVLLADSGQFMSDVSSPYGDVNFGEPVKPNSTSDAMFNALRQAMQNPASEADPRIMLDDLGNPITMMGNAPGAVSANNPEFFDQAEINRENYLLNARTGTTSSYSPSGIVTESGKNYYLMMRDENGLGIYQNADRGTVSSAADLADPFTGRPDPATIATMASGLRVGSRGEQVAALQTALGIQNDGIFGRATQMALSDFNVAANSGDTLGALSQQYESGGRGVFAISSGRNDPGGVSYGAHQLASVPGTMADFIASSENAAYASSFANLTPGTATFNQAYSQVANNDPVGFEQAQRDYITRTHYEPVRQYATDLGFDVTDRGIQETLYSQSVQHGPGGNRQILDNAILNNPSITSASPAEQIQAIYASRDAYASQYASTTATRQRYTQEVQQALRISNYYQTYYKSK